MHHASELQRYMKAISDESSDRSGRHLDQDEMIAYWQGRMDTTEIDAARSHILDCDQCLTSFRDVNDFFEPRREDETGLSEIEVRRNWRDLRQRIQSAWGITSPGETASEVQYRFRLRVAAAIAAVFFIAAASLGIWAYRLYRENQRLAEQQAAVKSESEALLAKVDDDRKQQVRELESKLASLQKQLDETSLPQTDIPEFELLMESEARGERADYEVKVPAAAKSYNLRIMPDKPEDFPGYVMEFIDKNNRSAWKSEVLNPDDGGTLSVNFSREFLSEGNYRFRLYGQKGKTSRRIGEYKLKLVFL
jgi:hypothetical protein